MEQLERLFNPDAIAVVGASQDPHKRGNYTISDLLRWGYEGDIYPVNPKYDEVHGLPAYPSVLDIPGQVDLAFIVIPAQFVPETIRECGEAGIAGAVINTAGFGEVGEESLEEELAAAAREANVRLIGPNIQGADFVHQHVHLLGGIRTTPGSLGMITQSGNMGIALSVDAEDSGTVGFSYNIGVGNETDIQFYEYLQFLGAEQNTDGVVMYIEGMNDGRRFLQEARRVSREKPIVTYKSGRTAEGRESAKSHTASLAGDVDVVESAYRQAGIYPLDSVDLLVPVAEALTTCPVADGPNVAVLTDGGGHATVTADAIERAGLTLPDLTDETQKTLEGLYELSPNLTNPVDVMGMSDHETMWYDTARHILEDPNVDALLITGGALGYEECWWSGDGREPDDDPTRDLNIARKVTEMVDDVGKPVVFNSLWDELGCSTALDYLSENGVPVYAEVDTAVEALRALAEYGGHLSHADEKSDFVVDAEENSDTRIADAIRAGRSTLSEFESKTVLADHGAPVSAFELAETADEAVEIVTEFDEPVAMKIASPDIVHKTEAGGVELDVEGERSVREAFDRIRTNASEYDPAARVEGVLVSPMVPNGIELLVGVVDDPEIGPVVTCGIGGVLVEAIDDVAFRALPVTEHDAREMIDEIEARALLDGPRDFPAVDRGELVELLLSISDLVTSNPAIDELDINPVVATEDGLSILDASLEIDAEWEPR
ncbi:acetate--CoA ligase family protein [Haloferax sp. YSSS75]|uniref:acetate--CoA ligase family protein n=1 Tax=Haloferax sp. YSSS75 TaxID=3388564 RepID=UPI00398D5587